LKQPFQVNLNQAPGVPPMVPPVVSPPHAKLPRSVAVPGEVFVGLGLGEGLGPGLGDPLTHWMVTAPALS
jgi:hypothetical protein